MPEEGCMADARAPMRTAWEHFRAGRDALAADAAREVMAREPGNVEAVGLLGVVGFRAGRRQEAIDWMERAIAANPNAAGLHAYLCEMYRKVGDLGRAIAVGRQVLALDSNSFQGLNQLGIALLAADDVGGALDCLNRQLALRPDHAGLHVRRSMLRMLTGDVDGGLAEYDWRLALPNVRPQGLPPLRPAVLPGQFWRGEPLAGKSLFIWSEQGLGDAIHCMRFFPVLAAARPRRISGQLPPKLHPLVRMNFPSFGIVPHGDALGPADYHCEAMSLLRLVGRAPDWSETGAPYLAAPRQAVSRFRQLFAAHEGLKVGLVWSGNSNHRDDAIRSMPGRALLPLLEVEGCRFFSLQIGAKAEDAPLFDAGLIDLSAQVSNMTATAGAIAALDLVIGVDTSLVHMAGALGTPVWTLLNSVPDWRWGLGSPTTPLYRSMRLLRQKSRGDWAGVIDMARAALGRSVRAKMTGFQAGHSDSKAS